MKCFEQSQGLDTVLHKNIPLQSHQDTWRKDGIQSQTISCKSILSDGEVQAHASQATTRQCLCGSQFKDLELTRIQKDEKEIQSLVDLMEYSWIHMAPMHNRKQLNQIILYIYAY